MYPESGSGSRRVKITPKNIKQLFNLIFWSAWCSLLRAEGFSCSLDGLYEGLEISKLQFLIKKRRKINFQLYIFPSILQPDPDPYPDQDSLAMLDPDQDSLEMLDPDPRHCIKVHLTCFVGFQSWFSFRSKSATKLPLQKREDRVTVGIFNECTK